MKHPVGDRVVGWLLAGQRSDLIVADVEISDELYGHVLAEAKDQHPEESVDLLEDRVLYRILTHPEWTPLAKNPSGLTEAKDSPVPVLYRMMGAAAESARGAANSAAIAALESGKALQGADQAVAASQNAQNWGQHAHIAFEQAKRCSELAAAALKEYSRIAKPQMIIKFIIIGLLILGLALLVTRPACGQEKSRIFEAQGKEPIRSQMPTTGTFHYTIPDDVSKPPESPPPLTADQKFRIRDLQHKYDDLRVQMAKLELDKIKLERQISDVLSSINGVAFDIARESKVATDNWNLNIDNLTWEKRK